MILGTLGRTPGTLPVLGDGEILGTPERGTPGTPALGEILGATLGATLGVTDLGVGDGFPRGTCKPGDLPLGAFLS